MHTLSKKWIGLFVVLVSFLLFRGFNKMIINDFDFMNIKEIKKAVLVIGIVLTLVHCQRTLPTSVRTHSQAERKVSTIVQHWTKSCHFKNFPRELTKLIYTFSKAPTCSIDGFPLTFFHEDLVEGFCRSCGNSKKGLLPSAIKSFRELWPLTLKEEILCLQVIDSHHFLVSGKGPVYLCNPSKRSSIPITEVIPNYLTNTTGIALLDKENYITVDKESHVTSWNMNRESYVSETYTNAPNYCITRLAPHVSGIGSLGSVFIIDNRQHQYVKKLEKCTKGSVFSLSKFDTNRFIFGGDHKVVHVYDQRTWKEFSIIDGHHQAICTLMPMEGKEFCSVCLDGTSTIWNIDSGQSTSKLQPDMGYLMSGKYCGNNIVAFGGWEEVAFHDKNLGKIHQLSGHYTYVRTIGMTPETENILIGGGNNLGVWGKKESNT